MKSLENNPLPDMSQEVLNNLAQHIDISCVQSGHSIADIQNLASVARKHKFVSAHVLPTWASETLELLANTETLVGSPVGFPSGGHTTQTKVAEATELLNLGVQEMDVVAPIGRIRSGDASYVRNEFSEIVELVENRIPLRAIIEVSLLDDDQIRLAVDCAIEAGVPWIKTATGWTGIPTSIHHISVIAQQAHGLARLKAAGGVRDVPTIKSMAQLGVERFGMNMNAAISIVEQAND